MQTIYQLTNNSSLKKHFFIFILGVLLGTTTGYYLVISELQENAHFSLQKAMLASFIGVIVSYGTYYSSLWLDNLLPWKKNINNRLSVGIVIHFLISFTITILLEYVFSTLISNSFFTSSTYIKTAILLFITVLIYEVVYFALYSYYTYATLQIETVKQEREQIELQLKALKSQLSPHFLFNGLNTASSLAFKDENNAEKFIRKLAIMYDYTLKSYNTKLIFIKEELTFVNSYIFLLQTRFGTKFNCKITLPKYVLQHKIPPLTLQMLIENAVKHNVMQDNAPLYINIFFKENKIIIENNITQKPIKVNSFNIGLKNINKRYLLLTKKGISVTNGQNFTVKLPLI